MADKEEDLATMVHDLRRARKLSLAQLGAKAGVDPTTIWKIEHGKTPNPGNETLGKISDALGVTVSQITGERPMPKRKVALFDAGAMVPVMRVRVQASGHATWDDTNEWEPAPRDAVVGRPNARAATVTGDCMGAYVLAGERVIFDPDAAPRDGDMVIVTTDEGATLVKWYRVDPLGRPYLRADDGTEIRPNGAKVEGVVLTVARRALRDPQLTLRRAADPPSFYEA